MRTIQLQNKKIIAVLLLFIGASSFLHAQDLEEEKFGRHKVSFLMAFGFIPEHSTGEEVTDYLFIVPTIGFNYDLLITRKFGLGLHTDLILQKFEVEELKDDLKVERLFPVTTNLMASYRPSENWTILAGGGVELETNKNFPMICFGVDYGIELNETWELGFNFMFEHRLEAYNSYLLGIGFAKTFGPKETPK